MDPFTAEPLPGGRTLISDSLGFRVIEIVDATGEIVWSYGTFNVSGPGPGLLNRPHSAQRLANGNTLICDSEGNRVIEVNRGGTTVWSFGTGVRGSGPNQVFNPNSAVRVEQSGDTIISDSDNNRVIVVDRAGSIVREYGASASPGGRALSNPRASLVLNDGSTLIADLGNMRLTRYGYPVAREYVATSGLIDPSVGAFKAFKRITVNGSAPPRTSFRAEYTTSNGLEAGTVQWRTSRLRNRHGHPLSAATEDRFRERDAFYQRRVDRLGSLDPGTTKKKSGPSPRVSGSAGSTAPAALAPAPAPARAQAPGSPG